MIVLTLVFVVLCWAVLAIFGGWIASAKGRSIFEGLILGGFFGPLGCIVEAVLPNKPHKRPIGNRRQTHACDREVLEWLHRQEDCH